MTNEHTEASLTQELRNLAEATLLMEQWYTEKYLDNKIGNGEDSAYIAAANPAAILSLLDRLEKAEKDAARYRWIAKQDHKDRQWVDTYDEFKAARDKQIDAAMEANK